MLKLAIVAVFFAFCSCQKDPHYLPDRNAIVQLFEWKFKDVANECESFLAPKGFAGVQVSPIQENVVIAPTRPWWERYQPVSYRIISRSGSEIDFIDMVQRCNKVGIRVYVDVVFNHMSGDHSPAEGTGGSDNHPSKRLYPDVPYGPNDFHWPACSVDNYQDPTNVRNCELVGLHDLNQGSEYVRGRITGFLDHLVDLGVAGFRVDGAKHMWPEDLQVIFGRVKNLSTAHGFESNLRPFVYMEVIDWGNEPISKYQYSSFSVVTEFKYSMELKRAFLGNNKLKYLSTWGASWGFLPESHDALVFINNHDTQRNDKFTYKLAKNFKMANAFMMSHPYGYKRIMSSYDFRTYDQGPPHDPDNNILSPGFTAQGTCTNGWICEHRWREVYNMVEFSNVVRGTNVEHWWDNWDQQIAFSRGDKGFIAFTLEGDINRTLQTGLPGGTYCEIISGMHNGNRCTGKSIVVENDGTAFITLRENDFNGVLAIHIGQKLH